MRLIRSLINWFRRNEPNTPKYPRNGDRWDTSEIKELRSLAIALNFEWGTISKWMYNLKNIL
jgi:hypothetical protein